MLSRLIASIKSKRQTIAPPPAGNYVGLMGGLGNQLFQYAYARYLVANGVAVSALATNLFKHDQYGRKPLVQAISRLPAIDLQREQIAALQIMADEDGVAMGNTLREAGKTGVFCRGYWQDPRYASAVAVELAADLQAFGADHRPAVTSPCVLHVRRHDYGHHGLLPLQYYRAALEQCGQPEFQVVTDEPNFCEYAFSKIPGYSGVVRGNTLEPWDDFFLMSTAPMQIIANSSFSWWTAWLGEVSGVTKKIIAPAEWSLLGQPAACPVSWQRIEMPLQRP